MSPILDIQYRLRELGRLRMGKQVATGKGGKRPAKLDNWRITSASKELLEVAAEKYGGTVEVWADAPNEGEQFELLTESESLDILIPPNDAAFSQWMELWAGGGCKKRCDGVRQVKVDRDCSCPKDINERIEKAKNGEACNPVTRFNVMLPDVPDAGVWRLETHGYNAATELAAFKNLVDLASAQGRMISAKLRIDHRMSKKDGQTFRYVVPVVEISETMAQFFAAIGADLSDVPMTLPPTTERRSLPGELPALPHDVKPFSIDEADGHDEPPPDPAAHAPVPAADWVGEAAFNYGAEKVIEAAETVRAAMGKGNPITGLGSVDPPSGVRSVTVGSEPHVAIMALLEGKAVEAGSVQEPSVEGAADEQVRPPSASPLPDPNDPAIKARVLQERNRHRVRQGGWVTCQSRVTFSGPCDECGFDPNDPENTLPVQHPCPVCGSDCKPWRPENANKPSWLCSNDDCDSDGEGNRWTSFHDDPWKPGGEIEQMKSPGPAAEAEPVQESLGGGSGTDLGRSPGAASSQNEVSA